MTYDLIGKAVALTGGSQAIGCCVALTLAREGARLAVMARSTKGLAATSLEEEKLGGSAVPIACDVTDDTSIRSAIDRAAQDLDGIDVFLNITGITLQKPLLEANPEDF